MKIAEMLGTTSNPALINPSWDARPRRVATIPPGQEMRLPGGQWLSNYTNWEVKVRVTVEPPLRIDLEDSRLGIRDSRDGKLRIKRVR